MSITNAPSVTAEEWPDQPRFHPFDEGPDDAPAFSPDAVLASVPELCPGWKAGRFRDEFFATLRGADYAVIVRAATVPALMTRIAEINWGLR